MRNANLAGTQEVATTDYGYDGIGRLSSMLHHKSSTNFAGYDFAYDVASHITEIDSLVDGLTTYTHDFTGQLTGADHANQADETYEYDENGNRTISGYDVDPNNQLASDGTYTYEYDDEGNRTAKENISTGERVEYEWDHRNRLINVTFKDSLGVVIKTVDESYDYLNRWVRSSTDPDGVGSASATDRFFIHEDGQIVLEFNGGSASDLTNRYLWGPMVDQILADEQVSSLSAAGNVIWPLTDHLNTTRDLVDRNESTGAVTVTNHREFDSFGNRVSETNAAVDHVFGFTGRYFDEASGLQNNWNRWYDAEVGQWVSEDPIGFLASDPNVRRYVSNSPLTATDSMGLDEERTTIPYPARGTVPGFVPLPDPWSASSSVRKTDALAIVLAYRYVWRGQMGNSGYFCLNHATAYFYSKLEKYPVLETSAIPGSQNAVFSHPAVHLEMSRIRNQVVAAALARGPGKYRVTGAEEVSLIDTMISTLVFNKSNLSFVAEIDVSNTMTVTGVIKWRFHDEIDGFDLATARKHYEAVQPGWKKAACAIALSFEVAALDWSYDKVLGAWFPFSVWWQETL